MLQVTLSVFFPHLSVSCSFSLATTTVTIGTFEILHHLYPGYRFETQYTYARNPTQADSCAIFVHLTGRKIGRP